MVRDAAGALARAVVTAGRSLPFHGIAQTFAIAQLCRQHGLLYTPHTSTNGIGFAINLQLMAASGFAEEKELEYPFSPPGWTIEGRDAILEEPFRHDRGTLQVPDRPGLGFSIDEKALKKHGKRFFVMDRKRLVGRKHLRESPLAHDAHVAKPGLIKSR